MYPPSNSNDFFANPLSSPPKKATAMNKNAAAARKAPPPPPKPAGGRPAAVAAAASKSRKTPVATRRRHPAVAKSSSRISSTASGGASSFYSSSASSAAPTDTSGFYGSSNTPAPAPAPSNSNQWDSWTAPAPSNTNQWQPSTASVAPTPATSTNGWTTAAPAPVAPAATTNNDWYSGATTTGSDSFYSAPVPASGSSTNNPATSLQGSMDTSSAPTAAIPTIFQPQQFNTSSSTQPASGTNSDNIDFEMEAPLLEELGIHFDHILLKTKTVCWPLQRSNSIQNKSEMINAIVEDADLIGPICYCLLLGGEMVLTGKLQFGYIYGFALFGCLAMTLVVNLMTMGDAVSFWVVASVLGYALIPVNILALVKIVFINLLSLEKFGRFLGIMTVAWSTTASTRLLEVGCGLREQRYLIAYPIALLYSAFVLITIF